MKIKIETTTSKALNTPEKREFFTNLKIELEEEICRILNVDYELYKTNSNNRKRPYKEVQHVVRNILYNCGFSLVEITYFFDCDHTTVINSNKFVNDALDVDFKAKGLKKDLFRSFKFRRIFIKIKHSYKQKMKKFVIVRFSGKFKLYVAKADNRTKDEVTITDDLDKAMLFNTEAEAEEVINKNQINKATILPIYIYE